MYHPLPMNQHMSDIEPVAPVPPTPQKDPAPALLFEMIRSFVTLAQTLNLSHAVAQLASTRQTVRRHIQQLEKAMGAPLFTIENRRYSLTKVGVEALPEAAISLIGASCGWMARRATPTGCCAFRTKSRTDGVFTSSSSPCH